MKTRQPRYVGTLQAPRKSGALKGARLISSRDWPRKFKVSKRKPSAPSFTPPKA